MIGIFCVFSVLLGVAYATIIGLYIYYWRQIPIYDKPLTKAAAKATVSIVIAARNEADNILDCLGAIQKQSYPAELLQIIVVNDHSEDETAELITQFFPRVQLLHLPKGSTGKKQALTLAISKAESEWIVTTDADCTMKEDWLSYLMSFCAVHEPQMLAAPVSFQHEKSIFEYFQTLDFMGMMGVSGAGIQGEFMYLCNGANLCYRRQVFEEVNGYAGVEHLASGDDMLLMEKIVKKYPDGLAYLKQSMAQTYTQAKPTFASFLSQRLRWATKSGSYQSWQTKAILAVVWLFCWAIFVHFLLAVVVDTSYGWYGLLLFACKAIADYFFLGMMARFFGRAGLMRYFIPSLIYHWVYILIVGTWSLLQKKYDWKGRSVR